MTVIRREARREALAKLGEELSRPIAADEVLGMPDAVHQLRLLEALRGSVEGYDRHHDPTDTSVSNGGSAALSASLNDATSVGRSRVVS